uniref:Reverse transcriptase domain-containing protein n=1 Tax=Lygus hesperus TaxID=30085 RepID=A0A0A9WMC2_LYGHE
MLFIDYKQAFDRVDRNQLYRALQEFSIPVKLINLIKMTMNRTQAKVLVGKISSRNFEVTGGVRQGEALSAILFNLALHKAAKRVENRGSLTSRSSQIMGYADDLAILGHTERAVREVFVELEQESKKLGLMINKEKTKYLVISPSETRRVARNLKIRPYSFEGVNSFKYLGVEINSENLISREIRNRIMAANRAYFGLANLFKSRLLTRKTKVPLYKALVRPIACYGAETWVLNIADENALRIFERRVLRRIFGPVCDGGTWSIRWNHELD